MIQFDKDGVTLFYTDANGKKISHNFMEGAAYSEMVDILSSQLEAARQNARVADNYKTVLATAQLNTNNGHPMDPPVKPLMTLVSDTGKVSTAPFDPPLPDFVPPAPAPLPDANAIMAARNAAPDKQAILYNMVLAMFRKMFPEA